MASSRIAAPLLSIEQDELVDMLGDLLDLLEKEPEFEDLAETIGEESWSEIMDMVRDGLDEANEMIKSEAVVTYYVYNSKVVDVKVELQFENPDSDEEIKVEVDVCFGANPKKSDVVIQCAATVEGEKATVKAVYSDGWDGDDYKSTTTFVVKAGGEKVAEVEQKTKWNKDSGKLTIAVGVEDEEISCSMKLVENKNGYTLSVDDVYDFVCEIDPSFSGEEFDCSVKLTFTEGVSISTPTFTNLDEIDEAAVEGIMEDVQSFVTENEEAFGSLGGSYEDDYIYDDDYYYDDVYVDDWT